MQVRGCFSNRFTSAACTLKAGVINFALDKGSSIDCQVSREGLLAKTIVGTPAKVCAAVKEKALQTLDELQVQEVDSPTTIVAEFDKHGCGEDVLRCQLAQELSIQKHTLIANMLAEMYAKCGSLEKAQELFDRHELRELVSWNALIAVYGQHGYGEQSLECFERMQLRGFSPTASTFVDILNACGNIGAVDKGQEIHAQIVRERWLEEHIEVGNALVDMYAKCDVLEKAQDVFDDLPARNVVSWSELIAGYAEHGHNEEVLTCFEQMQARGGCSPDVVIFACVLKSCGSVGAMHKGQEIHADIVQLGWSESDTVVGGALLVMYANCGMLLEAQEVFKKLRVRDVVAFTALMAGYAKLEKDDIVLELYDEMLREGLQPHLVTLTVVLGSCSRRGLVHDRSLVHIEMISEGCGMIPTVEHCSSI